MTPERWQLVERVYQAALACDGDTRVAVLTDACKGDEALRAEVDALLEAHRKAGSFGERPIAVRPSAVVKRLAPGTRLGSYRIETLLGAGGMGEVYRARDSKLGRNVALKVLPGAFTPDPGRRARFEREARLLATLSHSHIGQIYGLEETDGILALVMELVPGETLAEVLAGSNPIPIPRALAIAGQIAEALAAAHEKSIIHRDLKPANIIIQRAWGATPASGTTPSAPGRAPVRIEGDVVVKLIDFGLAREFTAESPGSLTTVVGRGPISTVGEVVGTIAYMSPEQARGEPLDARTDLFSLGAVLYEMLTGRPAFAGSAPAVIFDTILRETPPSPRLVNPALPPALDRLVLKLLQKNRDARYQTALEVATDLKQFEQDASSGYAIARLVSERRRWGLALGVLATLALVLGGWAWSRSAGSSPPPPVEYQQVTYGPDSATSPAVSPDGHLVAFVRGSSTFVGPGQIYVKRLPDDEPIRLTNDRLWKMGPVFSPDGSRIAYTTYNDTDFQWSTWVVPVFGREPPRLLLANASGLTWIGGGRVMFSEITTGFHMRVVTATENREDVRPVYDPNAPDGMAHYSQISPDGKRVLIVEMVADHVWLQCRVVPADGGSIGTRLGPDGACTAAAWSPDSRSVYFSSASSGSVRIWRQGFPGGLPEQITAGSTATEEDGIALDPDGRSLLTSVGNRVRSVWLHDGPGAEREVSREGYAFLPVFPHSVSQPFSPDNRQLFYLVRQDAKRFKGAAERSGELWMTDLETLQKTPVLPGREVTSYDLSRDGKEIVVAALDPAGKSHLWLVRLDGSLSPKQLSPLEADTPRFDPAGGILYRATDSPSQQTFIYRMNADGTHPSKAIATPVSFFSSVSPDGAWLVATVPTTAEDSPIAVVAFAAATGRAVAVCVTCAVDWTPGGKSLVVRFGSDDKESFDGRTFVIPLKPGQTLPDLPPLGIRLEDDLKRYIPDAREIAGFAYPAENTAVYAELRGSVRRNIFRVPLR